MLKRFERATAQIRAAAGIRLPALPAIHPAPLRRFEQILAAWARCKPVDVAAPRGSDPNTEEDRWNVELSR
jgi:hypothetical protein